MKKILVLLFSAVLVLCSGTACAPRINSEKGDGDYEVNLEVDPEIEETLRILVPSNDGDLERGYIEALIPGFQQKFKNVTVELDRRTISDEKYAESIGNAISSSNPPDLYYTNTVFYYYLVAKNCIVNLEPYYRASEEAGIFDIDADFYSAFFDMSAYKGKRYVVPRSADSVVCYYNKDILTAAGINPATDERFSNDWSWSNLISVCTDLSDYFKSAEGKAAGYGDAYALMGEFDWEAVFNALMGSYGSEAFGADGSVAIDSAETREMSEMLHGLKAEGRVIRPSDSRSTFLNGKTAFLFSSKGVSNIDKNVQIQGKFDVLPFPLIGENAQVGCGFAGWGISTKLDGAKRDLAWQFLYYMISNEGQMALMNAGLSTPPIRVDLAEEKSWAKGYSSLNLDAFLVHEPRKISSKFFTLHDPGCTFDTLMALQDFMKNLTESDKSVEWCIQNASDDLEEAIG